MTKKIIALLLCLLLFASGTALAEDTPLLWRASDEEGHEIYLFGTIHVGCEDMYPLPKPILAALTGSDAIALEIDVSAILNDGDLSNAMTYVFALLLDAQDEIENHFTPEGHAEMAAYLKEQGAYNGLIERMVPAAWSMLIDDTIMQFANLSSEWGVEYALTDIADAIGIPIYEVEGFEAQLKPILEIPDAAYELMALETLRDPQGAAEEMTALLAAWRAGDADALIDEPDASEYDADELALLAAYEEKIVHERNRNMADYAAACLARGETVFIAVGAGHMVGETGIPTLLREAGYQVELLSGQESKP